MKKTKYFLVLGIIALCSLSFLPFAFAAEHRSLDDWFNPPFGSNHGFAGWANPDLILYVQYDYPFGGPVPIWDCDYSGSVKDVVKSDGDHYITVTINVNDAPFVLGDYIDWFMVGLMDYKFTFDFIIRTEIWTSFLIEHMGEDDGYDENGNILLPVWWAVDQTPEYYIGLEHVKSSMLGKGQGEFLVPYGDYLAGDTANVKVNQIGITNPSHEYFWPAPHWPAELLFIY